MTPEGFYHQKFLTELQEREQRRLNHSFFLLNWRLNSDTFRNQILEFADRIANGINLDTSHVDLIINWPFDVTNIILDFIYAYTKKIPAERFILPEEESGALSRGVIDSIPTVKRLLEHSAGKMVYVFESHEFFNMKMLDLFMRANNKSYIAIYCTQSIHAAEFNPHIFIGSVNDDLNFFLEEITQIHRTHLTIKGNKPIRLRDPEGAAAIIQPNEVQMRLRAQYAEIEGVIDTFRTVLDTYL